MSETVGRSYRLFIDSAEALYDAVLSNKEDLLHTNITRTYLPLPLYVEQMVGRAGQDYWLVQRDTGARTPLNEHAYKMLLEQGLPPLHFQRTSCSDWTLDRFGSTELYIVHATGPLPEWMKTVTDISNNSAYRYDVLAGVLNDGG